MPLFSKKKKAPAPRLAFTDGCGRLLLAEPVFELPLREQAVVDKSVEFFNDPSPCYIHRGAVMVRLYEEISQQAALLEPGREHPLAQAPPQLRACLEWVAAPEGAEAVILLPRD